eukprot:3941944-Rhodomonas_salina.4
MLPAYALPGTVWYWHSVGWNRRLLPAYAMPSTGIASATTCLRAVRGARGGYARYRPMLLPYADTVGTMLLPYAATCLRACYALSSTELAYGATQRMREGWYSIGQVLDLECG